MRALLQSPRHSTQRGSSSSPFVSIGQARGEGLTVRIPRRARARRPRVADRPVRPPHGARCAPARPDARWEEEAGR
jgi:hypothetical protein